jgi:hypothetical protein
MSQTSGTTEDLLDIQMLDDQNGWAVGKNGTILKYGVGTGITDHEPHFSFDFLPNPTTGTTRFNIHLSKGVHNRLLILDPCGREVAAILDKRLQAGTHQIAFDLSQLPDGIYFIRLQAGHQVQTRRLLKW